MKIIGKTQVGWIVECHNREIIGLMDTSSRSNGGRQIEPHIGVDISVADLISQLTLQKDLNPQLEAIAKSLLVQKDEMMKLVKKLRALDIVTVPGDTHVNTGRVLDLDDE